MSDKTCGECRHFRDADFKDMCFWRDQHREACSDFDRPTNGDVIRSSMTVRGLQPRKAPSPQQ